MSNIHLLCVAVIPIAGNAMANITEKQKEILIGFMLVNYVKLFGKFSSDCGNAAKTKLWENLASSLNAVGPPIKPIDKWKRVSKCLHLI